MGIEDELQTGEWGHYKLSLCFTNQASGRKDIPESGGIAPPFFTSPLQGGEWSVSLKILVH
jgi:hypothetical protein